MKVAILAGGFGTRPGSGTEKVPKPMVDIGGRPMLWHIMSHYAAYDLWDSGDLVAFAVDINPYKAGTYLPGSGVEVLAPDDLARRAPTLVIAMNAVYLDEIAADMRARGLSADLVALG